MKITVFALVMLTLLLSACAPQPGKAPTPTLESSILTQIAPTQAPIDRSTVMVVLPSATREIQQTTPTHSGFIITATRGNLTIHRGPGFEYDITGYFLKGKTYQVVGRDEAGDWLMVSLPTGSVAWISNMTSYTDVYGNVPGLPVVTVDAARPAYIYNCTSHTVTTKPGGYIVEPLSKVTVNPYDFYYVYDHDVTKTDGSHPIVAKITVTEGETATVHTDGNGNTYACNSD